MQRRGAEGAMPHSLRQQGLDRDENLESTAVRRRGNWQGARLLPGISQVINTEA